jgi:UDP-N-acetylmuramate: L-alanyl-gamma-D-glutamyl-meso-diaminopimelate ligase
LPADQRLDPERLIAELRLRGRSAAYLPDVEAIIGHVIAGVRPGDVVCVFSNGGFGGIHARLLARLGERDGAQARAG